MKKLLYVVMVGLCLLPLTPLEAIDTGYVSQKLRDAKELFRSVAIELREIWDSMDQGSKDKIRTAAKDTTKVAKDELIKVAQSKDKKAALKDAQKEIAKAAATNASTIVMTFLQDQFDQFTRPQQEAAERQDVQLALSDVTAEVIKEASNPILPKEQRRSDGIKAGMLALEYKPELAEDAAREVAVKIIEVAATNTANDGDRINATSLQKDAVQAIEEID